MKDAARTWALVVGIDEYDDPAVPRLTGAARDAAAAVTWLRAVGVPDGQILLNVAPCAAAQAEIGALGLPTAGCTEPEIWRAVARLGRQSGERLFVFLSGHGLFEPSTERLFLTQEATDGDYTNLGIGEYIRLFRSMNFRRQFLVMDGCLNYPYSPSVRSTIRAAMHSSVVVPPSQADTTLVACFAASQGEQALEIDGRGLFMSELLRSVDPHNPNRRCLSIDDMSGRLQIRLDQAIDDIVGPIVTDQAGQASKQQHPSKSVFGQGEAWPFVPFVTLDPAATARLRVLVDPPDAVAQVEQIRVRTEEDVRYDRVEPRPPASAVTVPVEGLLPTGTALSVRCRLRAGAIGATPSMQELTLDADRDVVFTISTPATPSAPTEPVRITSVGASGSPEPVLTWDLYDNFDQILTDTPGITMTRREVGPMLTRGRAASPRDLALATNRIMRELNSRTSSDIGVMVESPPLPTGGAIRLRLPRGGAQRLAGVLANHRLLTVDGERYSLTQIEEAPEVPADAGAVDLELTLPWGRWTARVVVEPGGVTKVSLPTQVGLPPLRLSLAGSPNPSEIPGNSLIVTGRARGLASPPQLHTASGAPVRARAARTDLGDLRVDAWPTTDLPPWATVASLRATDPLLLPLHPYRPVLVALGPQPRAEPFSTAPQPQWDLLISAGRLDTLSTHEAEELTREKWEDPLLGVAGAYALLTRGRETYLEEVLHNLRGLDDPIPDIPVLLDALGVRTRNPDHAVGAMLETQARARAVPVFRWGVPLAMAAATRHGLTSWLNVLQDIDRTLVPTSTWTMWRG